MPMPVSDTVSLSEPLSRHGGDFDLALFGELGRVAKQIEHRSV